MITAQVSEHMTLNGNINLYGKRGFMYPAPIDWNINHDDYDDDDGFPDIIQEWQSARHHYYSNCTTLSTILQN